MGAHQFEPPPDDKGPMLQLFRVSSVAVMPVVVAACTAPPSQATPTQPSSTSTAQHPSAQLDAPQPKQGKVSRESHIAIGLGHEHAETLNPLEGWAPQGFSHIYDGLITHDEHYNILPALATSVPAVSADGLTVTATVRQGVTFHDGSTFGPEDVVATYTAALDPAVKSPAASRLYMIKDVRANGNQVIFTLDYPFQPIVHLLDFPIVPSEMITPGVQARNLPLTHNPVGTGPYKVDEFRDVQDVSLIANPDYWGPAPTITHLDLFYSGADSEYVELLEDGALDGAPVGPAKAKGLIANYPDEFELIELKSVDFRNVILPMTHPFTGDRTARQAMNLAVDRAAMVKNLRGGHATPAITPFSPHWTPWHNPAVVPTYDVAKANRMLDGAGWVRGADGIRVKAGNRASFHVYYGTGDPGRNELLAAFAKDMRAIGVEVTYTHQPWEELEQPGVAQNHGVVFGAGDAYDPGQHIDWMLDSSIAGQGLTNHGHYKNEKIDRLMAITRESTNEAERIKAFHEIQTELVHDPHAIYFFFVDHTYVQRKGYRGFKPFIGSHVNGATSGPWWNVHEWSVSTCDSPVNQDCTTQ